MTYGDRASVAKALLTNDRPPPLGGGRFWAHLGSSGRLLGPSPQERGRLGVSGGARERVDTSTMRVAWVLFDQNGTLLDPSCLALPLGGGEAERALVGRAFTAAVLMTMASTLSRAPYRPLDEYLSGTLERELRATERGTDKLPEMLERARQLDPFEDAAPALGLLHRAGIRLGVLTNSTAQSADEALQRAGLREHLEAVLGSDAVGTFKPHPQIYDHAVQQLGVRPDHIYLVAGHAWDVMGAKRRGLRTAWVARQERWLLPVVPQPDVRGANLIEVAEEIIVRAQQGVT